MDECHRSKLAVGPHNVVSGIEEIISGEDFSSVRIILLILLLLICFLIDWQQVLGIAVCSSLRRRALSFRQHLFVQIGVEHTLDGEDVTFDVLKHRS